MDKQSIAAKIRALLSKTVANGATEAEAVTAMDMARKIMDRHQLSMNEIELQAEGTEQTEVKYCNAYELNAMQGIADAVSRLTETKVWLSRKNKRLVFFGLQSDAIFADWLIGTMTQIIVREAKRHAEIDKDYSATKYKRCMSFIQGACARITQRIIEEVDSRRAMQQMPGGNAIVLASKQALVTEEFAKLNLSLNKARNRKYSADATAYYAGQDAGSKANWNRPVNGGAGMRAISR